MKVAKQGLFFLSAILISLQLLAQDPDKTGTVDITSSFKPSLKEVAKINFNATPPPVDTTKPRLRYEIPNPNLVFAYQPGTLKPLALQIDSGGVFANSNYIKAGFGSLSTPYVLAGFSFGDGHYAGGNVYLKHVSSKGKREYQQFSNTDIRLSGFYKTARNMEWNGSIGMKMDKTYKYGYEPETLSFDKDSIRQRFQTIGARLGARNIEETALGVNYSPQLKIDIFSDNHKNSESNTVLDIPVEKKLGENISASVTLNFDLTRFSPKEKSAVNNSTWSIAPTANFTGETFRLQAGIRPSWDNKEFKMFPNILAEIGTPDKRFTLHAGWTGYIRKTTYQYLASQNPWLWMPASFKNSWIEERFAGFKGSVGNHVTYNAKVGFNRINNQPLFINDTLATGDGKSFQVVNEGRMNVLHLGGELGFNIEERFSLLTGLKLNQYSNLRDQEKAWGLPALELNSALRLQILKDLWLKGDLFAWNGTWFMKKNGDAEKLKGAFDLNAGLEFKVVKNISLWAQFNNILNKEYQRWHQYPVYGFNFVGGVIFTFDQKP